MKICMALMGLDIGGAETHVLELSRALAKKGYDITVVSNGGVYVEKLESAGIRHISLPLNSKRPDAVIKSYLGLSRLFRSEKFDIVHAHARIPAFLCGLLKKKYGFRFMTSAHWVFKVTPLWKLITNWGERSVAVSEDIKQYLIDNYGFCPDNISVTINGIDTESFAPPSDASERMKIRREFDIGENERVLLHVSRIDGDRSAVAFALCEAMKMICASSPEALSGVRLLIAGGGNDLEKLREKADDVNSLAGRKLVILAGARADINDFLKSADLFVGVSRAALEAMSSRLPTVLAGNEGYLGIYTPDKFVKAYDGNFCCRGTCDASPELLEKDLLSLLSMPECELDTLGASSRTTVEEHYSVGKMADDYISAYSQLVPYEPFTQPDVVISGYYGFENMGDDSFLQMIISLLRKNDPSLKIAVLSNSPKKTSLIYGVKSVYRYDLIKIYKMLKSSRLLISGGGTLLQNETSNRSLMYYSSVMALAKKAGTPVFVYANGLGPLNGSRAENAAKKALLSADMITLREKESLHLAKDVYGADKSVLSADPAVCLTPCTEKRTALLRDRFGIENGKKYFAIAIRPLEKNPGIIEKTAFFCREAEKRFGVSPIFVPMQTSVDIDTANRLYELTGKTGCVVSGITAKELLGILSSCEFVVGMRLHILVYALAAAKPMMAISYDPKVSAFMDYIGMDYCVRADGFDADAMLKLLDGFMKELPRLSEALGEKSAELKKLAERDAELAASFIKDGTKH